MATTTASVSISSDILSSPLSISSEATLMKAGTTADGLDSLDMGYIDIANFLCSYNYRQYCYR